jgi:hypothetical protein
MGLYGFKKRFVSKIKARTKHHTIRARRANEDEPGDRMHLYYGLRTKQCELIARPTCTKVGLVWVPDVHVFLIEGEPLDRDEKETLAVCDGFDSFAEMMQFWEGRFPFEGKIYHWNPLEVV